MEKTEKDEKIIKAIKEYHKRHGYMPSYREIAELCGYGSTKTIYDRIKRLFELGIIETDTEYMCPRAFRFSEKYR